MEEEAEKKKKTKKRRRKRRRATVIYMNISDIMEASNNDFLSMLRTERKCERLSFTWNTVPVYVNISCRPSKKGRRKTKGLRKVP